MIAILVRLVSWFIKWTINNTPTRICSNCRVPNTPFHGPASVRDVEAPLDDPPAEFTSDSTGFNNGSSPSTSLTVHCVLRGSDFLNCMAVNWPPSPPPWISHWSVSGLDARWSHSLRRSRKRAVINPERLDTRKIRMVIEGDDSRELTVGCRRSSIEGRRSQAILNAQKVFRKREHTKAKETKDSLCVPVCNINIQLLGWLILTRLAGILRLGKLGTIS